MAHNDPIEALEIRSILKRTLSRRFLRFDNSKWTCIQKHKGMIYMFYFFEAKLWFDLREVRDDVSCYFWEMIYVYETFVLVHRTLEGVIRSSLLLFSVLLSKDQGYFCNNKQLDHFCKNPLLIPPLAIIRNSKERILQQTFKTQKNWFWYWIWSFQKHNWDLSNDAWNFDHRAWTMPS